MLSKEDVVCKCGDTDVDFALQDGTPLSRELWVALRVGCLLTESQGNLSAQPPYFASM